MPKAKKKKSTSKTLTTKTAAKTTTKKKAATAAKKATTSKVSKASANKKEGSKKTASSVAKSTKATKASATTNKKSAAATGKKSAVTTKAKEAVKQIAKKLVEKTTSKKSQTTTSTSKTASKKTSAVNAEGGKTAAKKAEAKKPTAVKTKASAKTAVSKKAEVKTKAAEGSSVAEKNSQKKKTVKTENMATPSKADKVTEASTAPAKNKVDAKEIAESLKSGETQKTNKIAEVLLTDAEGRVLCRFTGCDAPAVVEGYCRYHYLLNWKKIQLRKKILAEGKLENYINELTARYPDKYLEMMKSDLKSEKDFLAAVQELEIDDPDAALNDADAENYLEEVRGIRGDGRGSSEDDY